jgi:hypothetical protein
MTTEIEWRRQWKPNLTSIPWQPLNIDGDIFLIKCKFTQDSYDGSVSFKSVQGKPPWGQHLCSEQIDV